MTWQIICHYGYLVCVSIALQYTFSCAQPYTGSHTRASAGMNLLNDQVDYTDQGPAGCLVCNLFCVIIYIDRQLRMRI